MQGGDAAAVTGSRNFAVWVVLALLVLGLHAFWDLSAHGVTAPGGGSPSAGISLAQVAIAGLVLFATVMIAWPAAAGPLAQTALRRKHEVLEAVERLQKDFVCDRDADALFGRLLKAALAATGSQAGRIDEIMTGADGGYAVEYRAGMPVGDDLLARLIGGGKPVIDDDRMGIPLFAGGKLVGAVQVRGRAGGYGRRFLDSWMPLFHCCASLILAFRSAIDKEEAENRLSELSLEVHQANFDQLTNLPNRILAFDRLCQALHQTRRDGSPLTIMQVDLDQFNIVNDTLGHAAGDTVIIESASRLLSCVRRTDTVARLGSDEFLLILADRGKEDPPDVVARRVLESFSRSFVVDGTELFVSVSMGLTVAPADGTDPNLLVQNCGVALTQAKESGRNTYRFFTPDMNRQAARRLEIDTHLRHALRRHELSLHYQPLLELGTGRMVGCEALLRWDSPALGSIRPDRFVPLAEDTGLIVPIGEWVLRTACRQAKTWIDAGHDVTLAVNTSSRQLRHPQLVEEVRRALNDSGLPPEKLELEITESFLIVDPQHTAGVLGQLHDLGVHLSLDDFGTGYSSLSSLKRYPFHTLKIDRTFVRDVLTDPNDRALVKAIIAMARSLNLRVVAEGVETAEQLSFLQEQGCDMAQGFHYSRPLPPDQLQRFMGCGAEMAAAG